MKKKQLILFDGICQFCNGSVKFIVKRDIEDKFVFAPIQSTLGQALIDSYGLTDKSDTFALIIDDDCLTMSDGLLAVISELNGLWPLLKVFKVVPKKIRDGAYALFGRYRYKLFGKADECILPSSDLRNKFIGEFSMEQWRETLSWFSRLTKA